MKSDIIEQYYKAQLEKENKSDKLCKSIATVLTYTMYAVALIIIIWAIILFFLTLPA